MPTSFESFDGQAGNDANFAADVDWTEYVSRVQGAADSFSSDR